MTTFEIAGLAVASANAAAAVLAAVGVWRPRPESPDRPLLKLK